MSAVDTDGRRVDPHRGLHAARGELPSTGPYLLASVALILAYPLLSPVQRMIAFLLVSLPTLPATVMGLRRTPAGRRLPWWLLLGALISLNADNVSWYWYVFVDGRSTGDGTIAGTFAALGQVFMLSGAISVVARRGRNDIGGMIDTTIVSMAVGGALWIFLLLPHLQATRTGLVMQVTTGVPVFMLTGILGALTRLLLTAKRFIPALWLLVVALASALSGLIAVSMLRNPVTGTRPAWTDMIYMVGYAALTLFSLDRSVAELLRPGPTPRDRLSVARLAFLGLALGAMPVVGGVRHGLGQNVEGGLLAGVAALVTPLVMLRIRRVAAERAWAEDALRYQAHHDALTGLPNRREFAHRLTAALRVGRPLVVIFCDLDGFKAVNDRLGHAAGDRLLIEVASRLRLCVRAGDVVCRFGGDEFVMLCVDARQRDAAEVCWRIEHALRVPVDTGDEAVIVGASIGTVVGDGATSAEELIHRADAAMYEAKRDRAGDPGVRTVVVLPD